MAAHLGVGAVLSSAGERCGYQSYTGAIDELALWNRALSAQEVSQLNLPSGPGATTPVAAGALAHWPFEDNLNDVVGHVDGTAAKPMRFDEGVAGKAVFLGPGSAEFVDLGNTFNDVLSGQSGGYTLSLWIRPTSEWMQSATADQGPLLNKSSDSNCGQAQRFLYVFVVKGRIEISVLRPDLSAYQKMSGARVVRPNEWQHVVITYDAR